MMIHRLRARRFGCLTDCTVSFGPGLNIVSGPNESGKSTLQRALLLALLDRPAKRKANEESRQWGANRLFYLEVKFEFESETEGGRRWVLTKDYQENKARLSGGDGDTASWEEIQAILSVALGTTSAQVLQSTCCIAQDELAAISEGRKEICQSLESMVTGGDDDTSTADAITALQKAIQGLRRGFGVRGAANPGRLASLTERKSALEAQTASHRAALEQDDHARQRLADTRDRLVQIETELRPRLAARQAADRAFALNQQLGAARESEAALTASLERIDAATSSLDAATTALADPGNPVPSESDYHDLTRLNERVALLRSQVQEIPTTPPARPWAWQALAASAGAPALLALLSTGVGMAAATFGVRAGLPALVVDAAIVLSILLDAIAIIWMVQAIRQRTGPGTMTGEAAAAAPNASLLGLQARLERESHDLAARLAGLGCADWAALEACQARARKLRTQRDEAHSLLEGLLPPGQSRSDLENARKAASLKRRDLEEILGEAAYRRSLQLGPVEYQSLCQETDRLAEEGQTLERDSIGLQAGLDAARVTKEDLIALEERLDATAAELLHLEETLAIYELARDSLLAARACTLVRAQDQLAPLAGTYLAGLTGGRYVSIIVDSDLNVRVAAPGNAEVSVEPRRLSKGTQDQVFFALRLALMDLLFPSARPPLFLDDPFVKFDDGRREAALQLCQRIAQQRQVILFTCSTEYAQWGQVISMPAPLPVPMHPPVPTPVRSNSESSLLPTV